jgi:hypothetical protein
MWFDFNITNAASISRNGSNHVTSMKPASVAISAIVYFGILSAAMGAEFLTPGAIKAKFATGTPFTATQQAEQPRPSR